MRQVAARKEGTWMVIGSLPDVCKTPMGSSTPPVPYPVTAKLGDSVSVVESVKANGHPVVVFDQTEVPQTIGDAAGSANGVKSGTVGAKCWPLEHSASVRADGHWLIRHDDKFGMNGS